MKLISINKAIKDCNFRQTIKLKLLETEREAR